LTEEIRLAAERLKAQEISSKSFQTVFFGGGTPSLFSPGQISRVLAGLRENFGISDDAELTMELNPDTVDEHYLQQVAELGIN
jgi:Coproporphyrinogen III oxidase and related Fe-S oxidoreductases